MKKAILIFLTIICVSVASIQAQSVKKASKKPSTVTVSTAAIDTSEHYVFTKARAELLYNMLEACKNLVVSSDKITAKEATTIYLPKIDTLEGIILNQNPAYIAAKNKAQAKADSIAKTKTK